MTATPGRREVSAVADRRRDRRVTIRFDEAEYAAVCQAAGQARLAVSAWAGRVLAAEAERAVRPVPWAVEVAWVEDAAAEARRVGVLLNQAVAALHATGEAPAELDDAVAAARRARVALADAADRLAEAGTDAVA
jgi:hypothetical protein